MKHTVAYRNYAYWDAFKTKVLVGVCTATEFERGVEISSAFIEWLGDWVIATVQS